VRRSGSCSQSCSKYSRIFNRDLQGLDLIRFDGSGLIRDLTVMVRPRSALEALLAEVGPRLAKARGAA